jgi:hypothetical protein
VDDRFDSPHGPRVLPFADGASGNPDDAGKSGRQSRWEVESDRFS